MADTPKGSWPAPARPAAPPKPTNPPVNGAPRKVVTKTGGGFNPSVNPTFSVAVQRSAPAPAVGPTGAGSAAATGTPGGDFLSNEDIHAYCEAGRKAARQRAVERALDAAVLEGRLGSVPDSLGRASGSRMRARKVSKHLKRIAAAEKLIAKWYAVMYGTFEREYEAELLSISRGRTKQPRQHFRWR